MILSLLFFRYRGILHVLKIDLRRGVDLQRSKDEKELEEENEGIMFAKEKLRIHNMKSGYKLLFFDPFKSGYPKHYSITNSLKLHAVKRWLGNSIAEHPNVIHHQLKKKKKKKKKGKGKGKGKMKGRKGKKGKGGKDEL